MTNSVAPLISTAYLPPISLFALLVHETTATVERLETFPKQTYRNRAVILTANGPLPLVVPVVRHYGNHTRTENIGISYSEPWHIKHWRAIVSAYSASPYFLYYRDEIEKIITTPHERLIDLNNELLVWALKKLKIDCTLHYNEDYAPVGSIERDYRNSFSPKKKEVPTPLLPYRQVFDAKMPFVPNLSIIDLLFNTGPDAKRYLMQIAI